MYPKLKFQQSLAQLATNAQERPRTEQKGCCRSRQVLLNLISFTYKLKNEILVHNIIHSILLDIDCRQNWTLQFSKLNRVRENNFWRKLLCVVLFTTKLWNVNLWLLLIMQIMLNSLLSHPSPTDVPLRLLLLEIPLIKTACSCSLLVRFMLYV